MSADRSSTQREAAIARVLRPLGTGVMTMAQAQRAGQLLSLHWTNIYRLRRRFLANPVASAVAHRPPGPPPGDKRIVAPVEQIIQDTLWQWLPRQRQLAHPLLDVTMEIRQRCRRGGLTPPSRSTVARRWSECHEEQAQLLADAPGAATPPGHLAADVPLDLVQIDHTQSDLIVVDEQGRKPIGRPWLTVAIDVATRCVVGIYVAMERPGAATVALLLTRIALPKAPWLASLEVQAEWPMNGLPKALHLDNAAEFKSKALRTGCSEYGMELIYRPVGRPHFGGHIERMNRTLMDRLRGLPGATGNSPKGRQARKPEATAALTLREFEQWLALEIAQRYHHREHRGLQGATPAGVWASLTALKPPRQLLPDPEQALRFVVQFLPFEPRTVQPDGLTLFNIRYWHSVFAAWRETRRQVIVRYHPEDLSRVFVTADRKTYVEARYADLRRPRISLWEQRQARKLVRQQGQRSISEALIFKTIEQQRQIVARAKARTLASRRTSRSGAVLPATGWASPHATESPVDYSKPVEPYDVELW